MDTLKFKSQIMAEPWFADYLKEIENGNITKEYRNRTLDEIFDRYCAWVEFYNFPDARIASHIARGFVSLTIDSYADCAFDVFDVMAWNRRARQIMCECL